MAESVVATIEVKSTLTQAELSNSIRAAKNIKALKPSLIQSFSTGYQPPSILSYVVAYDGPASMNTVHGWLPSIHSSLQISLPQLPPQGRDKIACPSIDGVFVLGKGFLQYDNAPIGFVTDQMRLQNPSINWSLADTPNGSLLLFFLLLTEAVSGITGAWLNPGPYLSGFSIQSHVAVP